MADAAMAIIDEAMSQSVNPVIAYSGGKDSRVLTHLLTEAGVTHNAVADVSLMWDRDAIDNREWANEMGLQVAEYDRLDRNWIMRNPSFIFADLPKLAKLYQLRQQTTIKRHTEAMQNDVVFIGRRTQENSVPRPLYRRKNGILQCNPLRDWRYEHIWGYLHQNDIRVSPVYDHPIGQIEGASPWPMVSNEHVSRWGYNAFDLVEDYDASVMDWLATWWKPAILYRQHGYSEGLMRGEG
jgi:3'-phosphoadenosine 5'-phosphosulfate sulfotransferase (PAPS reductase)/FAD synthetase